MLARATQKVCFMIACFCIVGCASFPEIKSSDSFQGRVIDKLTGKPLGSVLVVGRITSELAAWDNSGDGGGPHILAQDYAISDSQGHFTFPSFAGVAGPAVYSFNLTRSVSGPYFILMGIGYKGTVTQPVKEPFSAVPCDLARSVEDFGSFLDGDARLEFRRSDYPTLLIFLQEWHEMGKMHFGISEKEELLYQKYKTLFQSS